MIGKLAKVTAAGVLLLLSCGVVVAGDEEEGKDNSTPHPQKRKTTSSVGLGSDPKHSSAGLFSGRVARRMNTTHPRIHAALKWLEDYQDPAGYWNLTEHPVDARDGSEKSGSRDFADVQAESLPWDGINDVGLAGLALLSYLSAGYTHKQDDFRTPVRGAILHLRRMQVQTGYFGDDREPISYLNHSIAAFAISDVVAVSDDRVVKVVAERALEFCLKTQRDDGSWLADASGTAGDARTTCWMLMALETARHAQIELEVQPARARARAWYAAELKAEAEGVTTETVALRTRAAMLCAAMLSGEESDLESETEALSKRLAELKLGWTADLIDLEAWLWGAWALKQAKPAAWETWGGDVRKVLEPVQRGWHKADANATTSLELAEHGSWDPPSAKDMPVGRVYTTALASMILATDLRYPKPPKPDQPETPESED